jgi:hypothetical protein
VTAVEAGRLVADRAQLTGNGVSPARTPGDVVDALRVEYDVFRELGFCAESRRGVVEEYRKYLRQSRFHVYRAEGEAMGVLREIGPGPLLPPVFAEFDVDPAFAHLLGDAAVAEVGVLAMRPQVQGMRAAEQMYGVAWHDAYRRGIRFWGAVVEEWLLDLFTEQYHFAFRRCGTPREYMGGLCIPVVMSFAETLHAMRTKDRDVYDRFVGAFPAEDLSEAEAGPRLFAEA